MKKATIFGASGFVGSHLLNELLASPDYEQVTAVVRKDLSISHPKLKVLTGDYSTLPDLRESMACDEIFIALGTTKRHTPNQKDYYVVDHDYPVLAARLAKEGGAKAAFVVSAIGANPASGIFYIRCKGEMERDVAALDFEHTHIFRPSMIMGKRKENRPLEKVAIQIWRVVNLLLVGSLKRYKGMDGKDIAKAMVLAAKRRSGKVKIYHWPEMRELL